MLIAQDDLQEQLRVAALKSLRLLDTPSEERFDRVTRLAVACFGVPMAMVNLVDDTRQWVKSCNLGMGDSVPRAHTVCSHTVQGQVPLVVGDLASDERFAHLPGVAGAPHFRFYAGHPLRCSGGHVVGVLCLVGHEPRAFRADEMALLKDMAALVEREFDQDEVVKLVAALRERDALNQAQKEELQAQSEELLAQAEELQAQAEELEAQNEELQQIQQELVTHQAFVHGILNTVGSGIVALDPQGQVTFKNPQAVAMSGLPEGMSISEGIQRGLVKAFKGHGVERPLSPEDMMVLRVMRGESVTHDEIVFEWPDGTRKYIQGSGSPLRNAQGEQVGSVVAMHDITERVLMERALQEREERHRALSEAAFEGIVISQDAEVVEVNAAFLRMLGYPKREEVLGKTLLSFVHPDSLELVLEKIHEDVSHPYDIKALRHDGQALDVEVVGRSFLAGGKRTRIAVFRDATERKKLERMREQFVSVVSHDLKNPLGALSASIDVLNEEVRPKLKLDDQADEDLDFWLEMAQKAVSRLLRLTNELLDDERLRFGESPLKQEHCQSLDLLQEAIGTMGGMANKAEVHLRVQGELIPFVADRDRLLQVLTNLTGNAIKFSPPGGTILLSARRDGKFLEMAVEDEGRGIPSDKLEAIFERFTQVEEEDASVKGGSGLGLAICRSIVKRHGGKIWAETRPEGGSRFVFALPILA